MNTYFETPILLLIFNREASALQVLGEIRKQKPKYLYIAADGPREGNDGDVEKCEKTRRAVLKAIDWDCEVKTYFRDKNRGCGFAPAEAISWFFENVEMGIILEDDILASKSFFKFCAELLIKYKDDPKIGCIAGSSLLPHFTFDHSYVLSNYSLIWGWATWRRAWNGYDFNIENWKSPEVKNKIKRNYSKDQFTFLNKIFNEVCDKNKNDVWDYQWLYHQISNERLSIIPSKNLTKNIGFNEDATHTFNVDPFIKNISLEEINFPLTHPNKKIANMKYDGILADKFYSIKELKKPNLKITLISKVQKIIAKIHNSRLFLRNPYFKKEFPNKVFQENNYISRPENSKIDGLNLQVRKPVKDLYLKIGNDSIIQGNFIVESEKGMITIGDRTFIGGGIFVCTKEIEIGDDVMFSWGCTVVDNNSHSAKWSERSDDVLQWKKGLDENKIGAYKDWKNVKEDKVTIKNKAWIGFNSTILKGVTIGEGSIVGAGSVVTKDVPDWTIVGGNPAKIIRTIAENER